MSIIALKMTEFFFIGFHSHVQVVRASTESFVEDEDGAVVVGAEKERWILADNLTQKMALRVDDAPGFRERRTFEEGFVAFSEGTTPLFTIRVRLVGDCVPSNIAPPVGGSINQDEDLCIAAWGHQDRLVPDGNFCPGAEFRPNTFRHFSRKVPVLVICFLHLLTNA